MTTLSIGRKELAPGAEVCAQCGTTITSLFPTCLWCSSSSQLDKKPNSGNPDFTRKEEPVQGLRSAELSLLNSLSPPPRPSTSKPLRRSASYEPSPHLSVDLRDESLMDALSSSFPALLKQEKGDKQVRHIHSDCDASTRLLSPMEGNNVAMLHPSIPSTDAGPSSSAAHRLGSRSRSLFTLTISPRSEEATTTTSTTSSMINAARSITRRLSSSAPLRAQPIPDHNAESKKSLRDQDHDDDFDGNGRPPLGKKRLHHAVVVHPPSQTGSGLSKKVSRTSLSSQPPISISLRPGTAGSSTSSRRDASPDGEEREAKVKPATFTRESDTPPASVPPQASQESRAVRWSLDDDQPTPKSNSSGTHVLKSGAEAPSPRSTSRSPTTSTDSSTPKVPRVGHPSRPYYSAIRKHCMSSPASSSRPPSSDGLAPPLHTSRSRPTSASVPPSAFNMTSVTPFARRPVSIGAVPSSDSPPTPSSRPGSAGKGMSVFDITDDVLEEEDVEPKPRLSSSLSRAFSRRNSQEPGKKRRMSATLFTERSSKDGHGSRRKSDVAEGPRPFLGLNMGISMSGETEMRMALAAMQQEEEGAAQVGEGGSSVGLHPDRPESPSQRQYRFRQTLDMAGGGASGTANSGDEEREGRSKKKSQDNTVFKKLKRGLKGLLK